MNPHEAQWKRMHQSAVANALAHGFLVTGPRGVGKKDFAFDVARLLLCDSQKGCGECPGCNMATQVAHPDLFLVQSEEGKDISIDRIRELAPWMQLKPHSATHRVVIVADADRLNHHAQSALLKTLEEPRGDRLFLLLAEHPSRIMQTIHSRLQTVRLAPIATDRLEAFLKHHGANAKTATHIAKAVLGLPATALQLLQNEEELQQLIDELKEFEEALAGDVAVRFSYVKDVADLSTGEIDAKLLLWLRHLHQRLLQGAGDEVERSKTAQALEAVEKTRALISLTNVNKRLALENLMLQV